jgi:hypothetical protein
MMLLVGGLSDSVPKTLRSSTKLTLATTTASCHGVATFSLIFSVIGRGYSDYRPARRRGETYTIRTVI